MGLMDELFNKEAMVDNTLEECFERLAQELGRKVTDLALMIKPAAVAGDNLPYDEQTETKIRCWVYQVIDGKPRIVREITLKEIIG